MRRWRATSLGSSLCLSRSDVPTSQVGGLVRDNRGWRFESSSAQHSRTPLPGTAGTILVDEFRAALLDGDPVDHVRELVPPAFATAVDDRLVRDLFAAAVALMARLSDGVPAGCVAEEIVSVRLMEEARSWLESQREEGRIDADQERAASGELRGLFDLFEDDDA